MTFLRWLAGFAILFCIIGLIFKIGGSFINLLLLFAGLVFISDILFSKKKDM
ncbi:hypothetical protein HBE96_22660 [Clostridium sp. P21]|uniref:Uncharacterized protein n=1 Tax=Clostridium muellerianum TaxID=2716538 RepID=A0A7Y0ELL4_9CLOT|nr:hypothetical protein [Clostridium muellerianum]NMM65382.1 hypothetical protein [Clostridium muellerianum]